MYQFSMEEGNDTVRSKLLLKLEELKAVVTTTITLDCQEGLCTSLYQPQYADPCDLD